MISNIPYVKNNYIVEKNADLESHIIQHTILLPVTVIKVMHANVLKLKRMLYNLYFILHINVDRYCVYVYVFMLSEPVQLQTPMLDPIKFCM